MCDAYHFELAMDLCKERGAGRVTATGRPGSVVYDCAAGKSIPVPPERRAKIEAFERES